MAVMALNNDKQYVPAIPLPFYQGFSVKCWTCKKRFWTRAAYRGHYALVHILRLDP